VGSDRCLDLGLLQDLGGGTAFNSPQSAQVGKRDNRGCLASEVDYLVGLGRILGTGGLDGHTVTVPAWDTRAGTIELAIPKLRQGAYCHGALPD
jgi:hypothetical protein